jgi:hypothetical protein
MNNKLPLCLQIAGLLHIGLVCAGALMPRAVNLRDHIRGLPMFIRRLFWVYYAFIGLTLISFGIITYALAKPLASGTVLARAVCWFLVAFWTLRLLVSAFIYKVKPYITNAMWCLGYHATNVVFLYLVIVYAWGAVSLPNPRLLP